MKKALRGLCLAVALWGCHDTYAGFEHWPETSTGGSLLGEFDEALALTEAVARNALRSPPLEVLVAAEVEAMVSYVRQSGRGQVELSKRSYGSAHATFQLRQAALQLIPYLSLESAPRELGHVALGALQAQLGNDAVYRQLPEVEEALAANDLLPELRDGVAILSLGRTDAQTIDRAAFMLSQWASMVPPPRALVLDLSRAEFHDEAVASRLFGVFAPGQRAFEIVFRDPATRQLQRRAWVGESGWSLDVYTKLPLFIVTSARTGVVAEVLVHALRKQRGALVLGEPTNGLGRQFSVVDLPWRARFAFTVSEFIGADEQSLANQPVIPDVCWGQGGPTPIKERSLAAVRAACGEPAGDFDKAAAFEYIREQLTKGTADRGP